MILVIVHAFSWHFCSCRQNRYKVWFPFCTAFRSPSPSSPSPFGSIIPLSKAAMTNTKVPDQENTIENPKQVVLRAGPPGPPKVVSHRSTWWKDNWWRVILTIIIALFSAYIIVLLHYIVFIGPEITFPLQVLKAVTYGLMYCFAGIQIMSMSVSIIYIITSLIQCVWSRPEADNTFLIGLGVWGIGILAWGGFYLMKWTLVLMNNT